jgi:hypothetical protein
MSHKHRVVGSTGVGKCNQVASGEALVRERARVEGKDATLSSCLGYSSMNYHVLI